MSMTDPVADMLTRIRNANAVGKPSVDMPISTLKREIAQVLLREGYIRAWRQIEGQCQGVLRVYLKYGAEGQKVITAIDRASSPGRRVYYPVAKMPRVMDGLGIAVVSTSKGLLSDRECRRQRVGGELLCTVR